ncbi:uncharacterized protein K452DRAFT_166893 [Aplosporella prunicola CBS 121167]|uniref:Uncharacterized protein n=1 Tax=Aplosporella prunicola CBS 121167 TaxID=1176127 RepID=A0A6A6BHP1_9PEZI|nr:uncharacterized protein K452DRAFT_166893 [Aplosporella prunicola CBS 121167]KAF2143118.1 hypothetical protein K452DRAFT_166893 [Aplosporella prunicola CBS 121167]
MSHSRITGRERYEDLINVKSEALSLDTQHSSQKATCDSDLMDVTLGNTETPCDRITSTLATCVHPTDRSHWIFCLSSRNQKHVIHVYGSQACQDILSALPPFEISSNHCGAKVPKRKRRAERRSRRIFEKLRPSGPSATYGRIEFNASRIGDIQCRAWESLPLLHTMYDYHEGYFNVHIDSLEDQRKFKSKDNER